MKTKKQIILLIALGLLAGSMVPQVLRVVSDWGHLIPQRDLATDYITGVVVAFILAGLIFVAPIKDSEKRALLWLWFAKCIVTLIVMLSYENSYGLDAYFYFDLSKTTNFNWDLVKFGDGTFVMGGICWILNHGLGLGNSYHAIKVICSSFGLLGIYFFYLGSIRYLGKPDIRLLYFLGLFPSVLFWSSILGKDPINLLGMGLYFYGVMSWKSSRRISFLIPLITGVGIASMIRLWYGLILLAPMLMLGRPGMNRKGGGISTAILSLAFLLTAIQFFGARFGLNSTNEIVHHLNVVSRSWTFGGSALEAPELSGISSIISFAPLGIFTALFRPLPGEVSNLFGVIAGLENLILLILVLLGIKNLRSSPTSKNPAAPWAISLVFVWSLLYGFLSFQNLGTAVRFKLQILPTILIIVFQLLQKRKIEPCVE